MTLYEAIQLDGFAKSPSPSKRGIEGTGLETAQRTPAPDSNRISGTLFLKTRDIGRARKAGSTAKGTSAFRRQDHDHDSPFHPGDLLDHRLFLYFLLDTSEHFPPELRMGNFPSAEEERNLYFIPFLEEAVDMPKLELEIMLFGPRPDFDFLHMNYGLVLLGFLAALVLLVFIFPVIHDPADRGR